MKIFNDKIKNRIPDINILFSILFGIIFGGIILFCLITQFYFYQAVISGILLLPFVVIFLIHAPRQTLLSLLVITIAINPSFHIYRNLSFDISMDLNFWTSDLIVIFIFIYLLVSNALGTREYKHTHTQVWHLGLPLLLWITAGFFSLLPAINREIAIIELIRMLRILLILIAVYKLVDRPEDIKLIAVTLLVAFAIQSALVIMEYQAGHPLFRLPGEMREAEIFIDDSFRSSGTMGHSSNFAKLAALCLPLCLAFIYNIKNNIWRLCLGIVLVGGMVSLFLTVSRAGILSSLFGIIWIFIWIFRKTKSIKMIVPLIFIALSIGFALFLGGKRITDRMQNDYSSAMSRTQMYSVALNVIRNHPFIGVGLNNYILIASDYDRTPEKISTSFPHPVHNIYLLYAAEMGIPAAIFFIWFLVSTIFLAFKCSLIIRRSVLDSAILKAVGIGIACSWIQGLVGWGHRGSIVHTAYLAIFAGALLYLKSYKQKAKHLNRL